QIVLANTYHLHFRPGEGVIEELGGLHRFMGWEGPILTDSGGFQVFSLRHTISGLDAEGVTFRSVYDGTTSRLTPQLVADIQRRLGADIAMCLDVCPPGGATRSELRRAVALTAGWAEIQRAAPTADGQLVFGISQGGTDGELRRRSIDDIVSLGFDGYAIGGLSVGEERGPMLAAVAEAAAALPADRARYIMGIGDPEGVLGVIERGIDMFDCVFPTRLGRTGTALTRTGRLNLRNARFLRDDRPLDLECACDACSRFSRAYLRHLVTQDEALALILLSEHNLRFLLDVTAGARTAIERGGFAVFKRSTLDRYSEGERAA
ncbi:MAG: tRNA guanosine(34) transglycosylase Tgt, partial [Gaiellales bacterium]